MLLNIRQVSQKTTLSRAALYRLRKAHLLPTLVRKTREAQQWNRGNPAAWLRNMCRRARCGKIEPSTQSQSTQNGGSCWHLTSSGIEAKGRELGIEQGPEGFQEFKTLVLTTAGITVEEHTAAKRRAGIG